MTQKTENRLIDFLKIIVAALALAVLIMLPHNGQAQQPAKKLPPKITIVLTDAQYLAVTAKLDSASMLLVTHSDLPSNQVQLFNQRFNGTWINTIGIQVQQQLIDITPPISDTRKKFVADSLAKIKPGKP